MSWRLLALCCVFFLGIPLCARDKTDLIVMANGDRLTCAIKALNEGTLYVSLDCCGHHLSTVVQSGSHREQAAFYCEDRERVSVHRHARQHQHRGASG